MKFILQWFIVALSVLLVAYILPGISISNFIVAIIVALIWGLLSFFVKPILQILALPITILTLGLFSLIINGFLFWIISTFVKGFEINNFMTAVFGAFLVSIFTLIFKGIFIKNN